MTTNISESPLALPPAMSIVQPPTVVIEPTHGWAKLRLGDVWLYRELIYFLTWRDIKVRYKQTVLGVAWVLVQPVASMIIFTVIFGRVAHLPSNGIPYALFTFTALLPWTYFAYVLQQAGSTLLVNANMISKVYFPRLVLPLASAAAGLVDFMLSFSVLIALMVWYHVFPGAQILTLPLFVTLAIVVSLGVGIWLAALSAEYRDVKYVLPFLIQIWFFASPVAYSASVVKGKLAFVYALNPMATVIQGFRWSLLGIGHAPGWSSIPSLVITLIILTSGLFYFRRMEQTFADII